MKPIDHAHCIARRYGTQDFVEIYPFYAYAPCERWLFVSEIAARCGRSRGRVSVVVSFKNGEERYVDGADGGGWASCTGHTDHLICRAALGLLADIAADRGWWSRLVYMAQALDAGKHPRKWAKLRRNREAAR